MALTRTTIFAGLFMWIFGWVLPFDVVEPDAVISSILWVRVVAGLLIVFGFSVSALCALTFGVRGNGTPAPFDPPRRLVKSALYKRSRNPMYIGFGIMVAGEALLVQSADIVVLLVAYALAASMFVIFYEEPVLRRKFGADYDHYCARVPRWL